MPDPIKSSDFEVQAILLDTYYIPVLKVSAGPVYQLKRTLWSVFKSTLKTYFDTFYLAISYKAAGGTIVTGTDDVKYVTPKAIYDAGISRTYPCEGRLTLQSWVAVSTTDQADKTTLYFTVFMGDRIAIYDGTLWRNYLLSQISLDISAFTASKPYDIFIYNNAGTLTLEGLVWTNGTTRATALTTLHGVYVKTGDNTQRYLGTIYMDAASTCQDTAVSRFVWNYYNRQIRNLDCAENTSHAYNGAIRKWNNSDTNNLFQFIVGLNLSVQFTLEANLKAGADASQMTVTGYLNDAAVTNFKLANYNVQILIAGSFKRVAIAPGYNKFQLYELGDHATSTGAWMWLNAWIEG
jgi:hypothetical protein